MILSFRWITSIPGQRTKHILLYFRQHQHHPNLYPTSAQLYLANLQLLQFTFIALPAKVVLKLAHKLKQEILDKFELELFCGSYEFHAFSGELRILTLTCKYY